MKKSQIYLLYTISAIAIIASFFIDPIKQNQDYHNFADERNLLNINNFWNVFSNLPFVIIGILGIKYCLKLSKTTLLKTNYLWFFIGIFLTGFGSGYYHFCPNNETLIWDRLPMTIGFMSFLSIIISKFIEADFGEKLLNPFLIIGILSIAYWVVFADLRLYVLVQFLPLLLVLIILLLSKNNIDSKKIFWQILLCYLVAKLFESFDNQVYNFCFNLISGHSLKHFAAAIAPFLFYNYIKKINN